MKKRLSHFVNPTKQNTSLACHGSEQCTTRQFTRDHLQYPVHVVDVWPKKTAVYHPLVSIWGRGHGTEAMKTSSILELDQIRHSIQRNDRQPSRQAQRQHVDGGMTTQPSQIATPHLGRPQLHHASKTPGPSLDFNQGRERRWTQLAKTWGCKRNPGMVDASGWCRRRGL